MSTNAGAEQKAVATQPDSTKGSHVLNSIGTPQIAWERDVDNNLTTS